MNPRASLSALLLASTLSTPAAGAEPRTMVVAYVPNWINLAAFAEMIVYQKVTHLNIAFENPTDAEDNPSTSRTRSSSERQGRTG